MSTYDEQAEDQQLEAIWAAMDALNQIRGEIRGNLDQDPDVITKLNAAVFLVGQYQAMRLNATVVVPPLTVVLAELGFSIADWARANGWADGLWRGDRCGCPDDRCIGHHHAENEECGCLPALLDALEIDQDGPTEC